MNIAKRTATCRMKDQSTNNARRAAKTRQGKPLTACRRERSDFGLPPWPCKWTKELRPCSPSTAALSEDRLLRPCACLVPARRASENSARAPSPDLLPAVFRLRVAAGGHGTIVHPVSRSAAATLPQ